MMEMYQSGDCSRCSANHADASGRLSCPRHLSRTASHMLLTRFGA
jgi:hypothetical protein